MNSENQDPAQGSSGPTESSVDEDIGDNHNVVDNSSEASSSTATDVPETDAGASSKDAREASQNNSVSFKLPSMNIKPTKKKENNSEDEFKEPSLNLPKVLAKPKSAQNVNKQENSSHSLKPVQGPAKDVKSETCDKSKNLSPAEKLKQSQISIPYKEPSWGGLPDATYTFEVLKNGKIIDNIELSKRSCHVVGRLPACDITMEHPSLSRFHAVIQFCGVKNDRLDVGWYLYDLDSTHGTTVNKVKIKPRVYYRIRVGHIVKFGLSTRMNLLQGPEEDAEEESEFTLTELKEKREMQIKEMETRKQMELAEKEDEESSSKAEEDTGCAWGMGEDAREQEGGDATFLMDALPQNEELYIDDPKKALRGFFEREGLDMPEYDMEELGNGKHTCRVEVPIDTPTGQPVVAEVTTSGKKKDAVAACALEACRILDKMGELRKANHESRKKKAKNWEEADFYDSDDDTFLDRTGAIEKKREYRMKKAGKVKQKTETYDSLVAQLKDVDSKIADIETQLEKCKAEAAKLESEESGMDALDAFMASIKSGRVDTKTKIKLKTELFDLKKDQARLQKLADIARPANVPALKKPEQSAVPSKSFMLFGKLRGPSKPPTQNLSKAPTPAELARMTNEGMEEEEEEEEMKVEEKSVEKKPNNRDNEENMSQSKMSIEQKHVIDSDIDKKESVKNLKTDNKDNDSNIENISSKVVDESSQNEKSKESSRLGPDTKEQPAQIEEQDVEFVTQAKKRSKQTETVKSKKPKREFLSKEYNASDPDYDVWVPPKGQSGDGKTHLNAKFGY